MFRFTIRDVLWLTVVVSILAALGDGTSVDEPRLDEHPSQQWRYTRTD